MASSGCIGPGLGSCSLHVLVLVPCLECWYWLVVYVIPSVPTGFWTGGKNFKDFAGGGGVGGGPVEVQDQLQSWYRVYVVLGPW